MTKALLFDIDGVVLDSEGPRDDITKELVKTLGYEYNRDKLKTLMSGKDNLGSMQVLVDAYDLEITAKELAERKLERLQDLYANRVEFVPGFLRFYEEVKKGKEVAAVTGLDSELFALADKRLGLRSLFEGRVYNTDMIGFPKPYPEIILTAARQLGVNPEECVVFEDAPNGIVAALRANARVVALTRTFSQEVLEERTETMMGDVIPEGKLIFIQNYRVESRQKVKAYLRAI